MLFQHLSAVVAYISAMVAQIITEIIEHQHVHQHVANIVIADSVNEASNYKHILLFSSVYTISQCKVS